MTDRFSVILLCQRVAAAGKLFARIGRHPRIDNINNGAKPGGRVVDVPKLQKLVKDQGFLIDGGYGKIKGTTFRISNMGDETEASMNQLFVALDGGMRQL